MDGLECSEIDLSALEFTGRIDSEYYQKKFLKYEEMVHACNSEPMEKLCHFLIGPFGSAYDTNNYVEKSDFRYVRGQDVKPFFLQDTSPRFMSKRDFTRLAKYELKENDILVSVVGTLGNACIIQKEEIPAIFSCKSTAVRVDKIEPYFLLSYLNSKYGRHLLLRKERGAVQKGLNLDDLKVLDVPCFSYTFQKSVQDIAIVAPMLIKESNLLYSKAQQLLMDNLHFNPSTISTKTTTEKRLSESFGLSGRLDAEYYQPKYNDLFALLQTDDTVGSLCHIYDKNYIPKTNCNYKYIELANVELNGVVSGVEDILGKELPSRARRKVNAGQVIVSSIEGSLQSCAIIANEYDGALCSTGFYVVDSDRINSETLFMLFKSEPIQLLLKQRCSGTILTAIAKDEFLKMPLPLVEDDVQLEIAKIIHESFALRRQAQKLIAIAVRSVEIAIENNEDTAIAYIKERGLANSLR